MNPGEPIRIIITKYSGETQFHCFETFFNLLMMKNGKPMARLSISLKNEIVKSLEDEAEQKGKTVSSILSEAANLYIESNKVGLRSEDVMRTVRIIEIMHEIDAVPIPEILLDNLIKFSWKNGENRVVKRWYDRGVVLGNILRTYAKDFVELSSFVRDYRYLIPIDMLDIELNGNRAHLVVSGVGNSIEAAKCTSEGLRGLLSTYRYDVVSVETSEGFVKMDAVETPG